MTSEQREILALTRLKGWSHVGGCSNCGRNTAYTIPQGADTFFLSCGHCGSHRIRIASMEYAMTSPVWREMVLDCIGNGKLVVVK